MTVFLHVPFDHLHSNHLIQSSSQTEMLCVVPDTLGVFVLCLFASEIDLGVAVNREVSSLPPYRASQNNNKIASKKSS